MAPRIVAAGVAALLAAGCGPADESGVGGQAALGGDGVTVGATSGLAHPLPDGAPARFGFGAPADADRVAAWDLDVRPDGEGLPAGSGTVERGRVVWLTNCAACHGATGREGPNDRLVGGGWPEGGFPEGRTVGSYWPYATTLFDYIRRAMPQDRPASLTADETYAVIAWILAENGVIGAEDTMDATTLPRVVMPARDRFVPDDRTGGAAIR